MKIRIKGNALRIRLSRSEVDRFGAEGYLDDRTEFHNGIFTYALKKVQGGEALTAGFEHSTITMFVPDVMLAEWISTEKVGYSNTMDTGNGNSLFLLLEKDFKCLDAEGVEDQSDNFENPNHTCN